MSEVVDAGNQAAETALITQEAISEPTPEVQQICDAVELIREKGDVFDQLDWARRRPIGGLGGKLGAVYAGGMIGEVTTTELGYAPEFAGRTAVAITYAGSAAVAYKYAERRMQHKKADRVHAVHDLLSDATGENVELFRGADKRVNLLWHAVDILPAQAVATSLGRIAETSKATAIDTVTVDYNLVKDFIPEADNSLHQAAVTQDDWLRGLKGGKNRAIVRDETYGQRPVLTVSVAEAERICEKALVHAQNEPLDSVMRLLQAVSPKHPALAYYRPENGAQQHEKVLKAFRSKLERKLEDVSTVWREEGDVRYKQKTHLHGKPRVTGGAAKVDWRTNGSQLYQYSTDLYRELGVDRVGLTGLLRNHTKIPAGKLQQLCEVAGWSILSGAPLDLSLEGHEPENAGTQALPAVSYQTMPGLQARASEILLKLRPRRAEKASDLELSGLRKERSRRTAKVCGAILLASIATGIAGNKYADQSKTVPLPLSEQTEFRKTTSVPVTGSYEWFFARDVILWQPTEPAVDVVDRVKAYFAPKVENQIETNSPESGSNNTNTINNQENIGNIQSNGSNQVLWKVVSQGGMDSTGYWSSQVNDVLHAKDEQQRLDYSSEYVSSYLATPLPGVELLDTDKPTLSVEGVIDLTSLGTDYCSNFDSQDVDFKRLICYKLQVPVLNGTKIAAAQVEGYDVQLRVVTTKAGQQVLLVPYAYEDGSDYAVTHTFGASDRITYLLAPDEQSRIKKASKNSLTYLGESEMQAILDGTFDYNAEDYKNLNETQSETQARLQAIARDYFEDQDAIKAAWEQALGADLPVDARQRLIAQEQHMAHSFEYELAPLEDAYTFESSEAFVSDVLRDQEANCNVANTVLTLSNPDQLTAVSGFYNTNNSTDLPPNVSIISANEQHLWTVDDNGNVFDATPKKGLDAAEAAHFAETYDTPHTQRELEKLRTDEIKKQLAVIGAGIALSAIIGNSVFRRLTGRPLAPRLTKLYLERLDEADIKQAYNAFQHYRWGGTEEPNLGATVRRSRQAMLDSLRQESPAEIRKSLKDRTYRRALRRSNLIMFAMRSYNES